MSLPLKIVVSSLCCVTAGGGIIGSNYVFKTEKFVNIPEDNANKWENKLPVLLQKITSISGLDAKIDPQHHATNLAKTGNTTFSNKANAITSLKAWCKKESKPEGEKEHEQDLCKESIREGWLFKY